MLSFTRYLIIITGSIIKHISILVPEGDYVLSTVIGAYKAFNSANEYLEQKGLPHKFKIQLVGLTRESEVYGGLFAVRPEVMVADVAKTDFIIIPASKPQSIPLNTAFIPWIVKQHAQGAEVASLCVGAFLLASTGLLNGRECSTHWIAADAFRQMFPEVNLVPEKIITDEQGVYTSGGAFSFLNLVLYIIEKQAGREVAIYLSKLLEIEIERDSQSPFSIFEGQKGHEDEPIRKAQSYIETNYGEKLSVNMLAGLFAISRRNFERRFKKATANTPIEYLQRVKIEAAKKSLEAGSDNINEVMYAVGYTDSKAFRTTFKKITGLSPIDYRKKYNRGLAV